MIKVYIKITAMYLNYNKKYPIQKSFGREYVSLKECNWSNIIPFGLLQLFITW